MTSILPQSLITPDVIEDECIDVIRRLHPQHLAKLERQLGMPTTQTIERLKTVERLHGTGVRLGRDDPPVVLLGLFGTDGEPEMTGRRTLTIDWTLAMELVVVGKDRQDTMKRRGWYAMTIAECLLQRLPRTGTPIDAVRLLDIDFQNGVSAEKKPRSVGEAQLVFTVRVRNSLNLDDLPSDDTPSAPGTPGGPPATDYTPPEPWPVVTDASTEVIREPLEPDEPGS